MALYCGIDLHANNNVISVVDDHDVVQYEKRHPNDLQVIRETLEIIILGRARQSSSRPVDRRRLMGDPLILLDPRATSRGRRIFLAYSDSGLLP